MTPFLKDTQTMMAPAKPHLGRDHALVAAAASGDAASFEVLVRRYKRNVLAIGRRITGSIDDAEDIAQQAFLKAFTNLPSFRGASSFSTWLISIAMNEARMWKRKRSRCREMSVVCGNADDENAMPLDCPDFRPDPESTYSTRERRTLLLAKLNQLPAVTRRALELCDLQEESTSSTALLLGITASAVKSRRSRGRAVLRAKLARHLSSGRCRTNSDNGDSRIR